jgi:hypothetical protein
MATTFPPSIGLRSCHGRFLSARADGSARWDAKEWKEWEHFAVEYHGAKLAFRSCHGKYLGGTPSGAMEWNRVQVTEAELFDMEQHGQQLAFRTCFGYISAQKNGHVECNRQIPQAYELFEIPAVWYAAAQGCVKRAGEGADKRSKGSGEEEASPFTVFMVPHPSL